VAGMPIMLVSIAKITTGTSTMFYGFRRTPYLQGFEEHRVVAKGLETEFRNGTDESASLP
jgi:hypothetical protein